MPSIRRCWPSGDDPLMDRYHDGEWGVPARDDRRHFEYLILDGFQAGLSWRTILHKRENFRRAFANFDPRRVARFSASDVKCSSPIPVATGSRWRAPSRTRRRFPVQESSGRSTATSGGSRMKTIRNAWKTIMMCRPAPRIDAMSVDLKSRG
jgi:DNA-3-methyladenine glycosylase I